MSADPHQQLRQELGVYVLGALDPAERERVERHLSSCPGCRDEVARLAVLPSLLARAEAASAGVQHPPPPFDPVLGRVVHARRRARRRVQLRAAAAVLAAVALTALTSVAVLTPRDQPQASPEAQVYTTDDGATLARVEPRAWGMAVQIEAADLPPSRGYAALAVAADGHRAQVASWSDVGRDVTIDGSCYLAAEQVQRLEIVSAPDERVLEVLTPQGGDGGAG